MEIHSSEFMSAITIQINRAPVLTLWGVVVAERLGYSHEEALTLGKAVAGLNAQSKGRKLGIYKPAQKPTTEKPTPTTGKRIGLMGRAIPVEETKEGIRAVIKDQPISPEAVERYLGGKFGEHLAAVRQAMIKLAAKFTPQELADRAFGLYEQFRPEIPSGVRGWGAAGTLDLGVIEGLKAQP
jgi:hypothetical protein